MKKYRLPILLLLIFETVAITLWLTKDNLFYLFTGVFEAATIHYAVAKIFGPMLFGRGWCGYACWTAMMLDFLPYKAPAAPRKKLGWIRYHTFAASLIFVSALFLAHVGDLERIMFLAFIVGNALYYAVGIALAFAFKDNRAFCKYICPITVFIKPMSYYSLLRVKCDKDKCISCGKCRRACPMNVDVTDNSRNRANWHRVHPLHGVCSELPKRGTLTTHKEQTASQRNIP